MEDLPERPMPSDRSRVSCTKFRKELHAVTTGREERPQTSQLPEPFSGGLDGGGHAWSSLPASSKMKRLWDEPRAYPSLGVIHLVLVVSLMVTFNHLAVPPRRLSRF